MKVPPAPFTHRHSCWQFLSGCLQTEVLVTQVHQQLVNICIITLICTTKPHLIREPETNKFKRFLC